MANVALVRMCNQSAINGRWWIKTSIEYLRIAPCTLVCKIFLSNICQSNYIETSPTYHMNISWEMFIATNSQKIICSASIQKKRARAHHQRRAARTLGDTLFFGFVSSACRVGLVTPNNTIRNNLTMH